MKKKANTLYVGVISLVGLIVALCGHVCAVYHDGGVRMLYLLIPVLGGLALCYYIYPRDFFLCALPGVVGALGLWFVRVGGMSAEVIGTVLFCVAALVAVLKLKKGNGCLKGVRLLHEKTNYPVVLGSCAAAIAVQLLAAVAGSAVAYYLLYAMAAWLFALLVYYTVKML
jgi:hypothetical protein